MQNFVEGSAVGFCRCPLFALPTAFKKFQLVHPSNKLFSRRKICFGMQRVVLFSRWLQNYAHSEFLDSFFKWRHSGIFKRLLYCNSLLDVVKIQSTNFIQLC